MMPQIEFDIVSTSPTGVALHPTAMEAHRETDGKAELLFLARIATHFLFERLNWQHFFSFHSWSDHNSCSPSSLFWGITGMQMLRQPGVTCLSLWDTLCENKWFSEGSMPCNMLRLEAAYKEFLAVIPLFAHCLHVGENNNAQKGSGVDCLGFEIRVECLSNVTNPTSARLLKLGTSFTGHASEGGGVGRTSNDWNREFGTYIRPWLCLVLGPFTQDAWAHLHTNLLANPVMLLASCVNTPIDHSVFHYLHALLQGARVLCEWGLISTWCCVPLTRNTSDTNHLICSNKNKGPR